MVLAVTGSAIRPINFVDNNETSERKWVKPDGQPAIGAKSDGKSDGKKEKDATPSTTGGEAKTSTL